MESIISHFTGKFKLFLLNFFWGICLILVVILTFFLGRLTKFMESTPAFAFESKEEEMGNYEAEKNRLFGKVSTSTIVASSGGKKYYFVWCKAAGNISESKRRYFDTEELAQRAGYTLAANCK